MATNSYTPFIGATTTWYLGYCLPTTIQPVSEDEIYTIPLKYDEQPWRLAKDRYGDERLYFIFCLANPTLINDPIFDFKAGIEIRIPSKTRINKYMNSTGKN